MFKGFEYLFWDKTSWAVAPLKRFRPVNMLKRRLPKLKTSTFVVAFLSLSISGATYPGVPHLILNSNSSLSLQAMPRSVMQTLKSLMSVIKMLSGFISRWIICFLCIRSTASRSCARMIRAWFSSINFPYVKYWRRLPSFANRITIIIYLVPGNLSLAL